VAVRPDGPVGLDVEQVRDVADLDALAGHVRSPAERARGDLDPAGFFRTWTRKEALVKATGDGLATPMTAITLAARGPAVERWAGAGAPAGPMWLHDLSPAPDHPAALAGPGERMPEITEADGNAVLHA
jgi:4'-phosphopantetheinyl transferase